MEPNNRRCKASCGDFHCEISSPVLRILQVNDRGVVFESREAFEIGSTIELGFHVQYHVDAKAEHPRLERNEFITAEGVVVGSALCAGEDGAPIHEVTLLFSSMSARDCRALRRFTRLQGRAEEPIEEPDASKFGLN